MGTMAIFAIIMSVLGTLASVGAGIANNAANTQQARRNEELARETREDSQDFAREQQQTANAATMQMFNAMDSPKAKVQQFKDAGLSVGLMYGNNAGAGGSHASATGTAPAATPGMNAPFLNPVLDMLTNPMDMLRETTGSKKTEAETKKTVAEIDKTLAETKKIEEEAKTQVVTRNYQNVATKLAEKDLEFQTASFGTRLQILENQRVEIYENVRKTRSEIMNNNIEAKWRPKLYQSTLDLNEELMHKYVAEGTKALADAALARAEKDLTESKKELTDQEKQNLQQEFRMLKVKADEYEALGYKFTEANDWSSAVLSLVKLLAKKMGWEIPDTKENREKERQREESEKMKGMGMSGHGGGATW